MIVDLFHGAPIVPYDLLGSQVSCVVVYSVLGSFSACLAPDQLEVPKVRLVDR